MNNSLNEITDCKYISSIGMLKLLDDHNIISYTKEKITHDFSKLIGGHDGDCIYIKFEFIKQFIYNILPSINYKFILITGDGDETVPMDFFDIITFNSIINDNRIIHWYSANCIEACHSKLSLIPIGVNFHSLSFGEFAGWHHTSQSPMEQENIIEGIRLKSLPFQKRNIKCYSSFHFATYPLFGNPRKEAIDAIPRDLVFYEPTFISRTKTWINQSNFAFVLSPMGHGMDCHRTWEAIILGCIVIVKKSQLDSLYDDLPVLIVNEWSDINEKLLTDTIEIFKVRTFNYDKITVKYWIEKIRRTTRR